jgi:diguanylate cyclase (GGDEF)-like protein
MGNLKWIFNKEHRMLVPLRNNRHYLELQNIDIETLSQQQLHHLIDDYKNSIKVQQVLFQIASIPLHSGKMSEFFESIHKALSSIVYSENIIIATLDSDEKKLHFNYFRDTVDTLDQEQLDSLPSTRIKYTYTGYVLRTGQALLADREKMNQLMESGEVSQVGETCVSWLGVPLELQGKICGVLAIQSYIDSISYNDSDLNLLSFVANHICDAINRRKLSDDMLTMNKKLQQSHLKLEEKVQQRTNELVKSNFELHNLLRKQEKIQTKLSHDALHDNLTGLPNRTLFIDRLLQAMHRHSSRDKLKFAVLFIDLDRFKVVNDSLGHLTGDLLLKEVALRLEKTMRLCDSIARFGGDEFCILLEGDINHALTIKIAERIIREISEPYTLQGYEIFTSPSVGITLCQPYYHDPEEILRDADAAMYQAKSLGKACYAIFDVSMHKNALMRLRLEADLRVAVKEDELEAYFQPIVDLNTRQTVGFEALSRWNHHELGFVNPEEFITISEETGLIQQLGIQILTKALNELSKWRQLDKSYEKLTVSVNLSPVQLEDENLLSDIIQLLSDFNLPTNSLKLEITEGVLIDRFEIAREILNQFNESGIKIMLDDFGTGFSSLSYLHHFPIKIVKIDRSFINNMFNEDTDMAIIKSVEKLSSGLNMKVVAEGIENEQQYEKLRELNIAYGQGYLLSKPMPPEQVIEYLSQSFN